MELIERIDLYEEHLKLESEIDYLQPLPSRRWADNSIMNLKCLPQDWKGAIEQLEKDKAELIDVIKLVRKHGEVPYIPTEVIDNLIAKHTGSK